jgi:hypothetical protein
MMPSSFSRFLTPEELLKVRDLYLQSLEVEEDDESEDWDDPAPTARPEPGTPARATPELG